MKTFIHASFSPLRHAALLAALLCSSAHVAAATMGQLPFIPTRFHLCSMELSGLEGEAREDEMRQCLNQRFHAERTVRSDCAKQVKLMRPAPRNADERYRAQRECFIQHLSLSYKDLPGATPRMAAVSPATAPALASRPKPAAPAAPQWQPSTNDPTADSTGRSARNTENTGSTRAGGSAGNTAANSHAPLASSVAAPDTGADSSIAAPAAAPLNPPSTASAPAPAGDKAAADF